MIVSINQPSYIPWLGYFDRIDMADIHVILDDVQFEKNSLVNRNKIRNRSDQIWLTIPLATKGKFGNLPINKLCYADGGRWKSKHLKSITANYARAKNYKDLFPVLEDIYNSSSSLGAFYSDVVKINTFFLNYLGINTKIIKSSDIGLASRGSNLIADICCELNADMYISGPYGRNYLNHENFKNKDIEIKFHDYEQQEYKQAWSGHIDNLSIIDAVMNINKEQLYSKMLDGRKVNIK